LILAGLGTLLAAFIQQTSEPLAKIVILVKTGIQFFDEPKKPLDSRLRGNDGK
jgi:hypothetical protein